MPIAAARSMARLAASPLLAVLVLLATAAPVTAAEETAPRVAAALDRAGDNRGEIARALADAPEEHADAMRWLVARMPEGDLASLSAEYLLENVRLAFEAMEAAPWRDDVPESVFLDAVLPYAVVNERRDDWRADFRERFLPLVEGAATAGEAAALLNQRVFPLVNVKYSTRRPKACQSGLESIDAGLASCTGLSILLIEACRAVGVPARFVGVPLWSDGSGNHSWIEVWDGDRWRFTGAAEPTGMDLDRGWFTGRARGAVRDDPRRAVWATTWNDSPSYFPMVWARGDRSVRAVNVTDRYVEGPTDLAEGHGRVYVRLVDPASGRRVAAEAVLLVDGEEVDRGTTRDDGFDANDHLELRLPLGTAFRLRAGDVEVSGTLERDEQLLHVELPADGTAGAWGVHGTMTGADALAALARDLPRATVDEIASAPYASIPLTEDEAADAVRRLTEAHAARLRKERAAELEARVLTHGELEMPFWYDVHGEPTEGEGRALFISMHGGGGAPAAVNDRQWENQKRLYRPDEGVYVAPRAPTNTWNLWHRAHVDVLFDRLITTLVALEGVDPDKVYLMGYSAGGDGVFQLAPRMADRFAAAAMMAGHPNETKPDGLRNLPFTLHMGGEDAAYDRNARARDWKVALADLAVADEGGYPHEVVIHEGKGHWMDREDAVAVPWMAKHRRDLRPERVVWLQDDVVHDRFYWLAADDPRPRERTVVERDGNAIAIVEGAERGLRVRLDDAMVDLDAPVTVRRGDEVVFEGTVPRTIAVVATTLAERDDPRGVFTAEVTVPADE